MSEFFYERYIKKSKKDHYCVACGTKSIKIGDPHYYFVSKYETEFDYYRLCEKCGDHLQTCDSCREAWEDSGDLASVQECMEHIQEQNKREGITDLKKLADISIGTWGREWTAPGPYDKHTNNITLDRLIRDNPHLKYQIEQADDNLTHELKDKLNALILHNVRTSIELNSASNVIVITKEASTECGGKYAAQYGISLETLRPPVSTIRPSYLLGV